MAPGEDGSPNFKDLADLFEIFGRAIQEEDTSRITVDAHLLGLSGRPYSPFDIDLSAVEEGRRGPLSRGRPISLVRP